MPPSDTLTATPSRSGDPGYTGGVVSADNQALLKMKLEEFRHKKMLDKLNRDKELHQRDSGFVVPAPKKDLLANFVPSIIRDPINNILPNESATLQNSNTPNNHAPKYIPHSVTNHRKSWIPSSASASVSVQRKTSNILQSNGWDLKSEMFKVFSEAQTRAKTVFEKEYIQVCISVFTKALEEATRTATNIQKSLEQEPENHNIFASTEAVTFTSANTSLSSETPTPAFLKYRDLHSNNNSNNSNSTNIDSDDEVQITSQDKQKATFDAYDGDYELSTDLTPPRSKYLDAVIHDKNDDTVDNMCPIISIKSEIGNTQEPPVANDFLDNIMANNYDNDDFAFSINPVKSDRTYPKKCSLYPVDAITGLLENISLASEVAADYVGADYSEDGNSDASVKSECKKRDGKEVHVKFSASIMRAKENEVVCGPAEAKDGSVVVLTPRKANKKEKEELGVNSVVTNARRSLRFMPPTDWESSSIAKAELKTADEVKQEGNGVLKPTLSSRLNLDANTRERMQKLLEEHGNAFVPNKVLEMPAATQQSSTPITHFRSKSVIKAKNGATHADVNIETSNNSPNSPFIIHSVETDRIEGSPLRVKEDGFGVMIPKARRI
ncbi:hypothetical protein HK100_010657 [Physocladia obscura]|uniref:Uncharacterized protein n=1 Tax=Physocladia obscura TaxID=109957 RepID=A0AAD5XH23_9FUNG|nr:hypothetical protein HK100_010657 [Physocladia obscura]